MYIYLFIPLMLLINVFSGCGNSNDENIIFVEKYKNYDFDSFANKSFIVRNFDNGNPIVLIYDYSQQNRPCGFIRLVVSASEKTIIDYKEVVTSDVCKFKTDTLVNNQLAFEFVELNVFSLEVDSAKNVKVKVKFKEGNYDLIKFIEQPKDLTNWNSIDENWYERK